MQPAPLCKPAPLFRAHTGQSRHSNPNPNPNHRRQPRPEYQDEFLEQEAAARQQRHADGGGDDDEEGGMRSIERQMDDMLYAKDPSRVRLEASRAAPRPECVPRVLGEEEAATP